jgi:hypothetical protein
MLEELKKDIKNDYTEICRLAPSFTKHSLHEFTKTRTIVNSSYFSLLVGNQKHAALVPYAGNSLVLVDRLFSSEFDTECKLGV